MQVLKHLSYTQISWYITLLVSLVVYFGCHPEFIYDVEYMSSTIQPYPFNQTVAVLLMFYLFIDLWYNNENRLDTHIHHVESIIGILLGLYGTNVGMVNNCLLNEVSTIWLSLVVFSRKYEFFMLSDILMVPFLFKFVAYRVFPISYMLLVMTQNLDRFTYNKTVIVHSSVFILHACLQYYWFTLIVLKIKRMCKKMAHVQYGSYPDTFCYFSKAKTRTAKINPDTQGHAEPRKVHGRENPHK